MKWINIFLCIVLLQSTSTYAQLNKEAINAFIQRIVKDKSDLFVTEYIRAENGKDVFELESRNNKILLRGNNGLSVASALNYYLKNYCRCLIT